MILLESIFRLILAASWQMTFVIAGLLLFRAILSRNVPARFLYLAWLAVAIRLVVPVAVPAKWSPFNLAPSDHAATFTAPWEGEAAQVEGAPAPSNGKAPLAAKSFPTAPATTRDSWPLTLFQEAAILWGVGVAVLLLARAFAHWRFATRLRKDEARAAVLLAAMTGEMAAELRRGRITIYFTDAIGAPALHGVWRPKLLFPWRMLDQLTPDEIRLIVAHELGHHRRHDLIGQSLLQLAQAIHWFNPAVWVANRAARHDCELACDDYVVRRLGASSPHAYGATLLKVFRMASHSTKAPLVLGLVESKQQLKRRIQMIIARKPLSFSQSFLGGLFLVMVTGITLTREANAQQPAAPVVATTPAPSVAAGITTEPPSGWWKNGSKPSAYTVGVDHTQTRNGLPSAYVRSNEPVSREFGGMMQMCSPDNFKGKRLRVSAWMKTADVSAEGAHLWFRVDGPVKEKSLQFDNMNRREPVGSTDWTLYSVVLDVPENATALAFGFFVGGTGQAWVSDFKVEEVGLDVPNTSMINDETLAERKLPNAPINLGFN